MTNPFNCPAPIYRMMNRETAKPPALLVAVNRIGPKRVQWCGHRAASANQPADITTWSLDGERATMRRLLAAAGIDADGRACK